MLVELDPGILMTRNKSNYDTLRQGKTSLVPTFPPVEAFWHNSRRNLKTWWAISPFATGFQLYLTIKLFRFLSLCFQSPLLQICCFWERYFIYLLSLTIKHTENTLGHLKYSDKRRICLLKYFQILQVWNIYWKCCKFHILCIQPVKEYHKIIHE